MPKKTGNSTSLLKTFCFSLHLLRFFYVCSFHSPLVEHKCEWCLGNIIVINMSSVLVDHFFFLANHFRNNFTKVSPMFCVQILIRTYYLDCDLYHFSSMFRFPTFCRNYLNIVISQWSNTYIRRTKNIFKTFKPFQPSVVCHIETSHLICTALQFTK